MTLFFPIFNLFTKLLEQGRERLGVQWLEEIIHNVKADGSFCIVEILVAAQNNGQRVAVPLPQLLDQAQAVGHRHADVGKDDIGTRLVDDDQSLFSIQGFPDDLEVGMRLLDALLDAPQQVRLVVDDNHPDHSCPPMPGLFMTEARLRR